MAGNDEKLYFSDDVVRLTGVHERTLDYWVRSGYATSSGAEAHGAGSRRLYTFDDVVQIRPGALHQFRRHQGGLPGFAWRAL